MVNYCTLLWTTKDTELNVNRLKTTMYIQYVKFIDKVILIPIVFQYLSNSSHKK